MKYDFDEIIDRRVTDSIKWDVSDGELPMWVADMDFRAAPSVIDALKKRMEHGVFGYSDVTDEWYDAYINWWRVRHGLEMERDGLIFCTGVVPAISSIVRKLTTPNENVVIMTPVYNIFFNSIINNGCRVIESPLAYDGENYTVDLADLESKLADPQTSLMILCNPQNPVGKIWDRATLAEIGRLAKKHRVTVISDEIHCDITEPNKGYIPFASVSDECRDNSVTCIAPTKAFNLAGMQSAAVYVPEPFLRHKVWRGLNTDEVAEPNSFACAIAVAAFNEGGEWLDEMREYVFANRRAVADFVRREIPQLKVVDGDATYLVWIDANDLLANHPISGSFAGYVRRTTGLFLSKGESYGSSGAGFLRMNVACPRVYVEDGLARLKKAVDLLSAE